MICVTERYLPPMQPLPRPSLASNKPLYKGSMSDVGGEYRRKRTLDKQKVKAVENLKKKILGQHTNPMQNV